MHEFLSQASMKRNWFTITSLVSRDFKLKYRRSVLGVLWSVLNPLLMMCVMVFVFSSIFRFSVENYPLYVVLGNVLSLSCPIRPTRRCIPSSILRRL